MGAGKSSRRFYANRNALRREITELNAEISRLTLLCNNAVCKNQRDLELKCRKDISTTKAQKSKFLNLYREISAKRYSGRIRGKHFRKLPGELVELPRRRLKR